MAEPPSGGTRGADVVPALRDDHGQRWPWPPTRGPEDAAAPRGTWLVFLPGAFTPVCTGELGWLGALAEDVAIDDVAVRVVSCDAAPVLRRVREELALPEPLTLLSDFWPHGAACRALDVFDAETGGPAASPCCSTRTGSRSRAWSPPRDRHAPGASTRRRRATCSLTGSLDGHRHL